MNLAFIHPAEKVKRDNFGNLYTDGTYSKEIWGTYLKIFSHITVMMREDNKQFCVEEAELKFNKIPIKHMSFVALPNPFSSVKSFLNISLKKRKKQLIEKEIDSSDAVIVRIPGCYAAINYAVKQGKPCLVEVVGCPFDALWNHGCMGKILAPFNYFSMRKGIRKAPYLIYVTEKFLQRRYPSAGMSIACSDVRLKGTDSIYLEERKKQIAKNANERLIIGTASGLGVNYKGQQFVIRAISNLRKKGIDRFEYQIAGYGDSSYLLSQIKKYHIEDRVRIVGSLPHDLIFDWYETLDIYVQPSKLEGLPRALIEAMSCAVPCIGSRVGGIPELLGDEVIFTKGAVSQIEEVLLLMIDKDFRKEQAEKCFIRSQDYLTDKLENKRTKFMKKVFKV